MRKLAIEKERIPRIEYNWLKVARYVGKEDPAQLTNWEIITTIPLLGPDAGIVIYPEDEELGKSERYF